MRVEKYDGWTLEDATPVILQDDDIIRVAMENNPSDSTSMFTIGQTGWALKNSSEDMKKEQDAVLTAVSKRGSALVYVSDDLRCNDKVIATAVQQNPTALQFAKGGKNQSKAFLRATGLFDDIDIYDFREGKVVLSTRFSLGEEASTTATIFSLLMKRNSYFRHFNTYFPNAFDKTTCDPNWTDINPLCRGTFITCCRPEEFRTGVPTDDSCWRYSF